MNLKNKFTPMSMFISSGISNARSASFILLGISDLNESVVAGLYCVIFGKILKLPTATNLVSLDLMVVSTSH